MKIPNISKTEMKMEIDFKEMIKFLEAELKHCIELQNSFSLFPVHVPSAQAVAKADAFLKLEKLLEMRGPFTIYEEKHK